MSTLVFIEKLSVPTQVGCSSEEQAFPQKIQISIKVNLKPSGNPSNITLDNSVCYDTLRKLVINLSQSKKWLLVEHLANEIVSLIFSEFKASEQVWIKVEKPIYPDCETAGIELSRSR